MASTRPDVIDRRQLVMGLGAGLTGGWAPAGLRLGSGVRDLWNTRTGPHLRGAVFTQRRVYPQVDGPTFMGPGPFGAPITDAALDGLAAAGANLAVWSGPGPFSETPPYRLDAQVEDHLVRWLDRCRAAGLYTVIGFRSGPGRSEFTFHPDADWYPQSLLDESVWQVSEAQAAWVEMVSWTEARFRDAPALAGILAMVEPNGAWLDFPGVWDGMAVALARRIPVPGVPLLLSPDGWGDSSGLRALRTRVGLEPVLVGHDYRPRRYTHQDAGAPVAFRASDAPLIAAPPGDWACLEFGAVNRAPSQDRYLAHRIAQFEQARASWAAFHWTSGWQPYVSQENGMNLTVSNVAMSVLQPAWRANRLRPG